MIKIANDVYKNSLNDEETEKKIVSLDLDEESQKKTLDALKKKSEETKSQKINDFCTSSFDEKEHDLERKIQRVEVAVNSLEKLLSKKAEIHLGLNAPEEVMADFPDPVQLQASTGQLQIESTEGDKGGAD